MQFFLGWCLFINVDSNLQGVYKNSVILETVGDPASDNYRIM